jgi:hypothetical protein
MRTRGENAKLLLGHILGLEYGDCGNPVVVIAAAEYLHPGQTFRVRDARKSERSDFPEIVFFDDLVCVETGKAPHIRGIAAHPPEGEGRCGVSAMRTKEENGELIGGVFIVGDYCRWPTEVLIALYSLKFPDRTFRVRTAEENSSEEDGVCDIADIVDAETGELALALCEPWSFGGYPMIGERPKD